MAASTSRGSATTRVARKVPEIERADRYRAPFVLEGGAIHVDGEGTVLTTEECLLNPGRNPACRGRRSSGCCTATSAPRRSSGSAGASRRRDDGHVDNLACFAAPGVVALTWTDDQSDPQHAISVDAARRLRGETDARGRGLQVHRIHQPGPLHVTDERGRAASTPSRGPSHAAPAIAWPAPT